MSRDHHLWSLAIEIARSSEYSKFRIGAIIAKKWKVISQEPNKNKTHTQAHEYLTKGRHAEFDALRAANGKGDTIIIARLDRNGNLVDSIPCYRCLNRIRNSGNIRWVIYFKNGELHKSNPYDIEGHVSSPIKSDDLVKIAV